MVVRAHGGEAIVQNPTSALFPAMPENLEDGSRRSCRHIGRDAVADREACFQPIEDLRPARVTDALTVGDVRMAELDMAAIESDIRAGKPLVFGCPECGGVLWGNPSGWPTALSLSGRTRVYRTASEGRTRTSYRKCPLGCAPSLGGECCSLPSTRQPGNQCNSQRLDRKATRSVQKPLNSTPAPFVIFWSTLMPGNPSFKALPIRSRRPKPASCSLTVYRTIYRAEIIYALFCFQ